MRQNHVVLPEQVECWVQDAVGPGSRITRAKRLRLGGWHVNHALDVIDSRGRTHRLILRRWARSGWEAADPDYTAEREVRVLALLRSTPVSAPVVVAADPTGALCDVPALLLTRLPGRPPRPSDIDTDESSLQLAETLARIHDVAPSLDVHLAYYRLSYDRAHATLARWMPATSIWRQAVSLVRQRPPETTKIFIHRDYHPENTLWSRRHLSGVVDWTQASWGPAAFDVAHMRWNLVADHGQRRADRFLAQYRATTGRALTDQPYWDLVSLFDLLLAGDEPGNIDAADLLRFEDYAATALLRSQ